MEETNYTFSYICAKYNLLDLDKKMLDELRSRHDAKVILDWKGLGKEKARIKEIADPYLRTDQLEST